MDSVFKQLNKIDVSEYIEKKNNLNYLSWSKAWEELKKIFPTATYKVYENENGWNYFTDGKTCWVKTGVTIEGLEHIEYLPIMNIYNKSILYNAVTSVDVNKAIQRSITKAIARHGLGLYIYSGEDLPASEQEALEEENLEKPLTSTQINDIFLAAARNEHIAIESYKAFGYTGVREIKYKDYENIKKKAQELVKAQENKSEKESKKR